MSAAHRRAAALALTALTWTWAALVLLAPYSATHVESRVSLLTTATVYVVGGLVCHQRPERSFHLWGAQLPVCARCTGLYLAAPFGATFAAWRRRAALRRVRSHLLIAVAPSAATWLLEVSGLISSGNWIRAASAIPLGGAVAFLLTAASGGTEVN